MNQSLQGTPTVLHPTQHSAPTFNLQSSLLHVSYKTLAGLTALATATMASTGSATTLDVTELNQALESSLTAGRDAGKALACTATMVFFDSTFMKFIFGAMILMGLAMAVYAWYAQKRDGTTVGRVFWTIVVLLVFTALVGVLTTTFMAC